MQNNEYNKRNDNSGCTTTIYDKYDSNGPFRGCLRMGGKKPPLPKTCHIYPTIMKLGTVIPNLKKTQKIYESRDTAIEFC